MKRIEPADAENLVVYKLLTGIMVPRPIALVSTIGADGVFNVAPFSWNTVACISPPLVAFSPGRNPLRADFKQDTLRNLEATGEFVSNIVTYQIERRVVECASEWEPDVDEFTASGLTPAPCDVVSAPRVAESPVSFECRVEDVLEMGGGDCSLVLGRVVRIHIDESVWIGGRLDLGGIGRTGRMGGTEYVRTDDTVRLGDLRAAPLAVAATDYRYQ